MSYGLQKTVGLLPVHPHPDPGEGGPEEAVDLLEDGEPPHRRVGPRADLESTTPVDTCLDPVVDTSQPGASGADAELLRSFDGK